MRRPYLHVALAVACLLIAPPVLAQDADDDRITVSTTSVGIPTGLLTINGNRATTCLLSVEGAPIRVLYSGSTPTSSVGHEFAAGASFPVNGNGELRRLLMIRSGDSDATVQITCEAGPRESPLGASASASGGDTTGLATEETLLAVEAYVSNLDDLAKKQSVQIPIAIPNVDDTYELVPDAATEEIIGRITFYVTGAVGVTIFYGTDADCATGATNLVGPVDLTADKPWVSDIIVPVGNALCLTTDAAVEVQGTFVYDQSPE